MARGKSCKSVSTAAKAFHPIDAFATQNVTSSTENRRPDVNTSLFFHISSDISASKQNDSGCRRTNMFLSTYIIPQK